MANPGPQICPICASGEEISSLTLGFGQWEMTCAEEGPNHPFTWFTSGSDVMSADPDSLAQSLGIYDSLLSIVTWTDHWAEYGIVEHLFATAHPDEYRQLVKTYGHRSIKTSDSYSASKYLAQCLSYLRREGPLVYTLAPATGYWSYNSKISYWAHAPGPHSSAAVRTWKGYAAAEGFESTEWPALTGITSQLGEGDTGNSE